MGGKLDQPATDVISVVLGRQVTYRIQQGKGGVWDGVLWGLKIAQKGPQEPGNISRPGVVQHRTDDQLQSIADVGSLLGGGLVVWKNDHVQILLPQGKGYLLRRVALGVGGHLLAVHQVETGDQLADEATGLAADIALTVHQQLVEEGQGLGLLSDGQIGKIFLKDIQIGPQLLPALDRAGLLDDVAKLLLVGQHVHQPQIVIHRQQNQPLQRFLRIHERRVLVGQRRLGAASEVHVYPQ